MDQLGVLYDRSHRASSLYEAEHYKTADALCESILADSECSPWLKFEVLELRFNIYHDNLHCVRACKFLDQARDSLNEIENFIPGQREKILEDLETKEEELQETWDGLWWDKMGTESPDLRRAESLHKFPLCDDQSRNTGAGTVEGKAEDMWEGTPNEKTAVIAGGSALSSTAERATVLQVRSRLMEPLKDPSAGYSTTSGAIDAHQPGTVPNSNDLSSLPTDDLVASMAQKLQEATRSAQASTASVQLATSSARASSLAAQSALEHLQRLNLYIAELQRRQDASADLS